MAINRREFVATSGMVGLGLAGSSMVQGCGSTHVVQAGGGTDSVGQQREKSHVQRFNMSGFAVDPIPTVRVGIIGLGQRGPAYIQNMKHLEGVEFKALCDLRPQRAQAAKDRLKGTGQDPDLYTGQEGWKQLCERDDIDLVIITTPYYMHTMMAVYAMQHGRHVASAVPAAQTIDECWQLVETAEATRRHCMMLENIAYMPFQLMTLNMARQGFFGDVVHGDCAYNTSKMGNNFNKNFYWDMWWLKIYASHHGNVYPTHGLGPVSVIMDINRGDKFEYLVSVESQDFMMQKKARELAAKDEFFKPFADKTYRGNMSVTVIRTTMGRTIQLQHDATSPSPHAYVHGIYGTKGAALYDPQPSRLSTGNEWVSTEEFNALKEKYTATITRKMSALAAEIGAGHDGTDLLESWRLIDCLRNGLPLDMDVYDAAAWSSVVALSEWSVLHRSNSIDFPDFTAGAWKTNKPNMDIMLEKGGTTKVLV